jgi:chromate transporter
VTRPSLARLTAVFGWIGLASLGGGRSAYFHDALVVRLRWLRDEEFLQDLAVSQVMPGPNFSNLAVALGHRLRGYPGAACALVALVLPGGLLFLALAISLREGVAPGAAHVLAGMGAAVVGLILVMTWRILRVGLRGRVGVLLAAGTFLAVGPLRLPTYVGIAAMIVLGLWLNRPRASEALTPRGADCQREQDGQRDQE